MTQFSGAQPASILRGVAESSGYIVVAVRRAVLLIIERREGVCVCAIAEFHALEASSGARRLGERAEGLILERMREGPIGSGRERMAGW